MFIYESYYTINSMKKHFKKTVLFFDIDGTLVDPATGKIPSSAIEEISCWRNEGYLCVISTGRTYTTAAWTDCAHYEWDGFVGINGAEVRDPNGAVLYQNIFPPELTEKILETAKRLGHPVMLLDEEGFSLIGEMNDNMRTVMKLFPGRSAHGYDYHGQKVYYAMVIADTGYDYADYEKLGVHAAKSYYPYADLVLPGTSKAIGIKAYMDAVGAKEYYAFGDSLNDQEMLKGADIAVAMGSGDPLLFPYADIVSEPIDRDGLAKALKEIREKKNGN